eukprot:15175250-Alexandrium_andersonii.AAC.1
MAGAAVQPSAVKPKTRLHHKQRPRASPYLREPAADASSAGEAEAASVAQAEAGSALGDGVTSDGGQD